MRDEHHYSADEMERITSSDPLSSSETDPETILLHDSWTRFTQLLDATDEELNAEPFEFSVQRPPSLLVNRKLLVVLAIAASLLLCLSLFWRHRETSPESRTVALTQPYPIELPQNRSNADSIVNANVDEELAWDDAFDQRLQNLSGALAIAHGLTVRNENQLSGLTGQLQKIADEINANSL
jgi:hypothetical protein